VNEMKEIFQKHLTALAAGDWDRYKADLAPDIEWAEVTAGKRYQGIDEVMAASQRWKVAFPDLKPTISRSYELGDIFVGEIEWNGTHRGAMETSVGTIPATNKPVKLHSITIYRLKDGKFAEIRTFLDQLDLLRQIGAPVGPPAAKAQAERRVAH